MVACAGPLRAPPPLRVWPAPRAEKRRLVPARARRRVARGRGLVQRRLAPVVFDVRGLPRRQELFRRVGRARGGLRARKRCPSVLVCYDLREDAVRRRKVGRNGARTAEIRPSPVSRGPFRRIFAAAQLARSSRRFARTTESSRAARRRRVERRVAGRGPRGQQRRVYQERRDARAGVEGRRDVERRRSRVLVAEVDGRGAVLEDLADGRGVAGPGRGVEPGARGHDAAAAAVAGHGGLRAARSAALRTAPRSWGARVALPPPLTQWQRA